MLYWIKNPVLRWIRVRIKTPGIRYRSIYRPNTSRVLYDNKREFDFNALVPVPAELGSILIDYNTVNDDYYTVSSIIYCLTSKMSVPIEKLSDDDKLIIKNQWTELLDSWGITEDVAKDAFDFIIKMVTDEGPSFQKTMFEAGEAYVGNIRKYGAPTASRWCYLNWGTLYNARNTRHVSKNILEFDSVATYPKPVIEALAKMFPDFPISAAWHDMHDKNICGQAAYEKGVWSY